MDPNAAQAIQESKKDDAAAAEDLPACMFVVRSSCESHNVKKQLWQCLTQVEIRT
jgi:hypothetical protein